MTGRLPVETPQGVGNSQEDKMEEIKELVKRRYIKRYGSDDGFDEWFDRQTSWLVREVIG